MTKYGVSVPFAGTFFVWVAADNEDEAKAAAQQAWIDWSSVKLHDDENDAISDLDMGEIHYGKIVQGNVFYGPSNDVEVFDKDDDD